MMSMTLYNFYNLPTSLPYHALVKLKSHKKALKFFLKLPIYVLNNYAIQQGGKFNGCDKSRRSGIWARYKRNN